MAATAGRRSSLGPQEPSAGGRQSQQSGRKSSLGAAAGQGEALSWQQVHIAIVSLGEPADPLSADMLCSLLERFNR